MGEVVKLQVPAAQENDAEYESWWTLYPRKIAKGTARTAFRRARKKASLETLMDGVRKLAEQVKGKDAKYTPHASTWLNGERWLDEVALPPAAQEPNYEGLARRNWEWAVQYYRKTGNWHGPGGCPGSTGYRGPPDLLTDKERQTP